MKARKKFYPFRKKIEIFYEDSFKLKLILIYFTEKSKNKITHLRSPCMSIHINASVLRWLDNFVNNISWKSRKWNRFVGQNIVSQNDFLASLYSYNRMLLGTDSQFRKGYSKVKGLS